jgi:hypothetical protein
LGQKRQMGQEITGSLHTKEKYREFQWKSCRNQSQCPLWECSWLPHQGIYVQRRIPCQLLSALVYCPPPRLSQLQFSADSMADSIRSPLYYCPPDLKLKRTVRTVRTVFHRIREESSVHHQRLFRWYVRSASVGEENLPWWAYQLVFDVSGKEF